MMMGKKEIDGRYYLRGYVDSSPRQKNIYIDFMIDTSQRYTTISKLDAEKNNIDLKSLDIEDGKFEIRNEKIDAYVFSNCNVNVPNQNDRANYSLKLPKVYIPFRKLSASSLEADVSRLGLDFLENFSIEFQTLDLDRDQSIILEDKL
jgi:hypothetical protein